jgi:hypothetical protein
MSFELILLLSVLFMYSISISKVILFFNVFESLNVIPSPDLIDVKSIINKLSSVSILYLFLNLKCLLIL